MVKKLTKHGNSLALIIDRPILDILKIDDETPLEITTDGKRLVIAPAEPSARRKSCDEKHPVCTAPPLNTTLTRINASGVAA